MSDQKKYKIINIVGARPNFMKIAPFIKELNKHEEFEHKLVHTGQHYDKEMSESFFDALCIPKPDYNLGVGSKSASTQIAEIMLKFEEVCNNENPDLVVVVGDVNSTIACGMVANKLGIKLAHIEAGLRSFDNNMPEEINRILTDKLSDYLFVSEKSGLLNLNNEKISEEKIFFVGNIMIDSLVNNLEKIDATEEYKKHFVEKENYLVLTLHRPSNVDNKETLGKALEIINEIQQKSKIIWPLHPRTKSSLEKFGMDHKLKEMKNIIITGPLGYIQFISLVKNCKAVLTDSGGIQEETTYLGIPCITLRENTERPSTTEEGTNSLTGLDKEFILKLYNEIENKSYKIGNKPEKWDGNTAQRIVKILLEKI